MFDFWKRKRKNEQKNIADQISLGMNAENLRKYSEAGREYAKAYSGYDGESGKELQKSLSGIANGKNNLPGQRGYAAEVQDVAKRNAEEILKGSDIRYSRVDDLPGHKINETPFDIMAVDSYGKEIQSLGSQMKFNQGNPSDVVDTLVGKKYREKYPHAQYSVPEDRYDDIKKAMADKAITIKKQLQRAKRDGDIERAKDLEERLNYVNKANKKLVKSKLTLADAEKAVLNPQKVTVKEITKLGNDVGVKYAKSAAAISGTLTFARCVNEVIDGKMTAEEAAINVTKDSAKAAVNAYATGQANTMISSLMCNSSKEVIRTLGKSSAPAQIVTFTTNVFRIVNDRLEGRITDEECFHNITKSGIGIIGTAHAGKVVGTAIGKKIGGSVGAIGGPIGALVASVVAGVIIDSAYDYAVDVLKAPGIARQERRQIEKECELLHVQLEQYRENFRDTYIAHTKELFGVFGNSLHDMAIALKMNDADSFLMGANTITKTLGGNTQFNNVDEFEAFLESDRTFNL